MARIRLTKREQESCLPDSTENNEGPNTRFHRAEPLLHDRCEIYDQARCADTKLIARQKYPAFASFAVGKKESFPDRLNQELASGVPQNLHVLIPDSRLG